MKSDEKTISALTAQAHNAEADKRTLQRKLAASERRVLDLENRLSELLAILRRRVGRTATSEQVAADRSRLRELAAYDRLTVETPAARNHLLALLLICATLRRDRDAMQRLSETCLSQLELLSETRLTDVHAYLWLALFVATRNPQYRDLAKHYVQRYQPRSPRLRELVTLLRRRTAL